MHPHTHMLKHKSRKRKSAYVGHHRDGLPYATNMARHRSSKGFGMNREGGVTPRRGANRMPLHWSTLWRRDPRRRTASSPVHLPLDGTAWMTQPPMCRRQSINTHSRTPWGSPSIDARNHTHTLTHIHIHIHTIHTHTNTQVNINTYQNMHVGRQVPQAHTTFFRRTLTDTQSGTTCMHARTSTPVFECT